MASELVRELIESGVHFGHRTSRWNPKMQPFIFGKRNLIHIIDIRETVRGLLLAKKFVSAVVARGQDVLLVGTKRPAREAIQKQAQRCGMPYVNERWLGGTLTNFRTIRSRLHRLDELEKLETTGKIRDYSKKMVSTLNREKRRIQRNLEGIRRMERIPGALFIVDVRHEHIAIKEAKKLGIPTLALVDTDGDPSLVDVAIPGNDDAMRAIELIVQHIADAADEGKRSRPVAAEPSPSSDDGPAGADRPARRPRRMAPRPETDAPATGEPVSEPPAAETGDGNIGSVIGPTAQVAGATM